MSYQSMLAATQPELKTEIVETDAFLKSLHPLKFKRTADKRKINYVSSGYGISYAIFPLEPNCHQRFGWYYLYDKATQAWYRKTDYFIEALGRIEEGDPRAAERIFGAIKNCTLCKGKPCSAISYTYKDEQRMACYGLIVLPLDQEGFSDVRDFFLNLNMLVAEKGG